MAQAAIKSLKGMARKGGAKWMQAVKSLKGNVDDLAKAHTYKRHVEELVKALPKGMPGMSALSEAAAKARVARLKDLGKNVAITGAPAVAGAAGAGITYKALKDDGDDKKLKKNAAQIFHLAFMSKLADVYVDKSRGGDSAAFDPTSALFTGALGAGAMAHPKSRGQLVDMGKYIERKATGKKRRGKSQKQESYYGQEKPKQQPKQGKGQQGQGKPKGQGKPGEPKIFDRKKQDLKSKPNTPKKEEWGSKTRKGKPINTIEKARREAPHAAEKRLAPKEFATQATERKETLKKKLDYETRQRAKARGLKSGETEAAKAKQTIEKSRMTAAGRKTLKPKKFDPKKLKGTSAEGLKPASKEKIMSAEPGRAHPGQTPKTKWERFKNWFHKRNYKAKTTKARPTRQLETAGERLRKGHQPGAYGKAKAKIKHELTAAPDVVRKSLPKAKQTVKEVLKRRGAEFKRGVGKGVSSVAKDFGKQVSKGGKVVSKTVSKALKWGKKLLKIGSCNNLIKLANDLTKQAIESRQEALRRLESMPSKQRDIPSDARLSKLEAMYKRHDIRRTKIKTRAQSMSEARKDSMSMIRRSDDPRTTAVAAAKNRAKWVSKAVNSLRAPSTTPVKSKVKAD